MSDLLTIFNRLSKDNIADYYQALYWYCYDNHSGQFSQLYSILSTLQYKPSLTEKAEDVNFDSLGFPVSHDNMLLLATALRLYNAVQIDDITFVGLSYLADKNIYLAEYKHQIATDYPNFYAVYSVDEDGTIVDNNIFNYLS